MDNILETTNKVITECGHCFHTSCLMTNISHNGFGCPYCRTVMAEESCSEEDSEDAYEEGFYQEEEDYSLRGMRWLFQRVNEEPIEEDEQDDESEAEAQEESVPKPSVDYLTYKLMSEGVTMEQLVKTLLLQHEEYEENEEEFDHVSDNLFGRIRIILSNFKPEDELINNIQNSQQIHNRHIQSSRDIYRTHGTQID
jgi:hypothetical protein